MRRAFALLLACVHLLLGCAPPLVFGVDPAFSEDEERLIGEAIDQWNEVTAHDAKIRLARRSKAPWFIAKEDPGGGDLGFCETRKGLIRVMPGLDPELFRSVVLHELGHALDLDHVVDGVMHPHAGAVTFTPADLAECRDVGSCP